MVTVDDGTKPLSTDCNFRRLRISRPDPASSTKVSATSAMVKPRCNRPAAPFTVRLPEFFSTSFKLHREADNAGNNPNKRAVAKDAQTAKSKTRQSIEVSSRRGILPGLKCDQQPDSDESRDTPNIPPAVARHKDSANNWRTRRKREAPSAVRTPISSVLPVARASTRLATLLHAISSTRNTAAIKISKRAARRSGYRDVKRPHYRLWRREMAAGGAGRAG